MAAMANLYIVRESYYNQSTYLNILLILKAPLKYTRCRVYLRVHHQVQAFGKDPINLSLSPVTTVHLSGPWANAYEPRPRIML
jgi:hypothetical protein